jgi:hypothetical protein
MSMECVAQFRLITSYISSSSTQASNQPNSTLHRQLPQPAHSIPDSWDDEDDDEEEDNQKIWEDA